MMKVWCLLANIDDLLHIAGERLLESRHEGLINIPIDYIDISVETSNELKVYYKGKEIELPDMFWPAISNTDSFVVENLLINAGVKCALNLDEVAVARSKIATYQRLARNGMRVPKTLVFFNHPDKNVILQQMRYPFVMKPDNGYGGVGVSLIHNESELDDYLSKQVQGVAYMAQEYISTSFGKDIRVVMLNGEPYYSAMRNSNNPNEFRSNVHQGGEIKEFPIDDATKAYCKKIASLFDLPLLGLDLLIGDGEYVVVEVNAFPGMMPDVSYNAYKTLLEGFEEKFQKNV